MLACETERRLKNYLVAVADGESAIERLRQRLCEIPDFSPCNAFQRIDRDASDYVTSYEILKFLQDNRICSISENECYRLVKFFDSDEDGRLSFADFSQMVLPCEDNCMRSIAERRPTFRVARYENLPCDIERGVAGIIEREVELIRRLDSLKRDLECCHDFSPYAAFKTIDRCCESAVNSCNLTQFLRANGFCASEREVLSIIRRMDTSCAAKVLYSDFAEFMRGHGSACPGKSSSSPAMKRSSSACKYTPVRKSLSEENSKSLKHARSSSVARISSATSPKKACCDDCEDKCSPRKCPPVCRPCYPRCSSTCYPQCRPCYPLGCGPCYPRCSSTCYPLCRPCYPLSCDPCYPRCSSTCYPLCRPCYPLVRYCPPVCDPCPPVCRPCYPRCSSTCYPLCRPCYPLGCGPCYPRCSSTCYPLCRPCYQLGCNPCPPVCRPKCGPALSCDKERDLVKGLYDTIREERDLESAKLSLAKRSDFNFYDAFKIFDTCSRGYFTLADLREGLAAIGVYPTTSDMELYIKRYDKFNTR